MSCNCKRGPRPFGPSSTTTTTTGPAEPKFVLRTSRGTEVYGSRLEAEAAKRRAGGGSIVTRR